MNIGSYFPHRPKTTKAKSLKAESLLQGLFTLQRILFTVEGLCFDSGRSSDVYIYLYPSMGTTTTYQPLIGLKKDSFQVVLRWEYFQKHKYFVRLLRKVWRHVGGVRKCYILKSIAKHYKKGTLLNSLLCNTFTYVITKRLTYQLLLLQGVLIVH